MGFSLNSRSNITYFVRMKKSRYKSPYTKTGKTQFPARYRVGVYIIKNRQGEYLYIGYGETDVYKTMYRHFQKWSSWQEVVTYYDRLDDILCRIVYCTPKQAAALEKALIRKHKPFDNRYDYEAEKNDRYQNEAYRVYMETYVSTFTPEFLDYPFTD